jgi:hypothetical protein
VIFSADWQGGGPDALSASSKNFFRREKVKFSHGDKFILPLMHAYER